MRAQFILSEIGIGLRRNLAMAVSVVLVTLVSLFLVGSGFLAQRQVSVMKDYWYDRVQVSVFLCGAISNEATCADGKVTDAQRAQIDADLKSPQLAPYVQKVYFESSQEAYDRFKQQTSADSDLLKSLTPEQMPESYRIQLKDPTQYAVVSSVFDGRQGVETVEDQNQVLDRLFSLLNRLKYYSWSIAGVMLFCCVLLVFVTVRLTAFSRRRETGIMRLVGASNLVIQLPFILETMIAAAVGAALASAALVSLTHFEIQGRLSRSLQFVNYIGVGDALAVTPWLFLIGLGIAGVSSFVALLRYLRV